MGRAKEDLEEAEECRAVADMEDGGIKEGVEAGVEVGEVEVVVGDQVEDSLEGEKGKGRAAAVVGGEEEVEKGVGRGEAGEEVGGKFGEDRF